MSSPRTFVVGALVLLGATACTDALIVIPDGGSDGGGLDGSVPQVPGAGALVISEVMANPMTFNDVGEWVELHNPSASITYELQGCIFADANMMHVIGSSLTVGPGGYVTLAMFATALEGGFDPDYTYGSDVQLVNGDNDVSLTCAAVLVDAMSYTNSQAATDGASLSLDPGALSTTANDLEANWCEGVDDYFAGMAVELGTPGAPNPACP